MQSIGKFATILSLMDSIIIYLIVIIIVEWYNNKKKL